MNSKLMPSMLSVLTGDIGDLLNDKELMKGVNRLLLQFGFELKPIELKHDAIAPKNPHVKEHNFKSWVTLKGGMPFMFNGDSKAEMLTELNNIYGDKIESIKFSS